MKTIADLLYDKLGADDCYKLKDLAIKYHCVRAFDFNNDIIGLSYGLFWLGVITGSAIVKVDMQGCDLCEKAQAVISKELFEISQSR